MNSRLERERRSSLDAVASDVDASSSSFLWRDEVHIHYIGFENSSQELLLCVLGTVAFQP